MMKKLLCILCAACIGHATYAQTKTEIKQFNLSGPYAVSAPIAFDTVNVVGKKFDAKSLLDAIALTSPATGKFDGQVLPSLEASQAVGLLTFYINNSDYLKGSISVKGPKNSKVYVDGKEQAGELVLAPEHHTVAIKFLVEPKDTDSISVTIDAPQAIAYTLDAQHPYMFHDLTDGKRVRGMSLSADGTYVVVTYQTVERGGRTKWEYELREVKSGRLVSLLSSRVEWMPKSTAYVVEGQAEGKRALYKVNPATGDRTLFARGVPEGHYTIAPTEDYLIMHQQEEGPKKDKDVYEIVEMDDRQPGWRERSYISKFDIATGVCCRLTYGSKGEFWQTFHAMAASCSSVHPTHA